jgi:hypothetical protein
MPKGKEGNKKKKDGLHGKVLLHPLSCCGSKDTFAALLQSLLF